MFPISCSFLLFLFIGQQFLPHPADALPSTSKQQQQQRQRQPVQVRNQIEQTIQEVIPLEARDFYENLTNSDRQVLERVLSKAPSYASVGEVLTDLRNGSSTLYEKAVQMVTGIRQTVAKLSPSARAFVDQSVEQIQSALGQKFSLDTVKSEANGLVQRYRTLEAETKEELRAAFPMVAAILNNVVVQTLASGLLGIQSE